MKKLYTFSIAILAFVACKSGITFLLDNAAGFATAELSPEFSITCISVTLVIMTLGTIYKLTPKI